MIPFVKEKDFMAPSLRELSAEQTEGVFAYSSNRIHRFSSVLTQYFSLRKYLHMVLVKLNAGV